MTIITCNLKFNVVFFKTFELVSPTYMNLAWFNVKIFQERVVLVILQFVVIMAAKIAAPWQEIKVMPHWRILFWFFVPKETNCGALLIDQNDSKWVESKSFYQVRLVSWLHLSFVIVLNPNDKSRNLFIPPETFSQKLHHQFW